MFNGKEFPQSEASVKKNRPALPPRSGQPKLAHKTVPLPSIVVQQQGIPPQDQYVNFSEQVAVGNESSADEDVDSFQKIKSYSAPEVESPIKQAVDESTNYVDLSSIKIPSTQQQYTTLPPKESFVAKEEKKKSRLDRGSEMSFEAQEKRKILKEELKIKKLQQFFEDIFRDKKIKDFFEKSEEPFIKSIFQNIEMIRGPRERDFKNLAIMSLERKKPENKSNKIIEDFYDKISPILKDIGDRELERFASGLSLELVVVRGDQSLKVEAVDIDNLAKIEKFLKDRTIHCQMSDSKKALTVYGLKYSEEGKLCIDFLPSPQGGNVAEEFINTFSLAGKAEINGRYVIFHSDFGFGTDPANDKQRTNKIECNYNESGKPILEEKQKTVSLVEHKFTTRSGRAPSVDSSGDNEKKPGRLLRIRHSVRDSLGSIGLTGSSKNLT